MPDSLSILLRPANFSRCRTWRYTLSRSWLIGEGLCAFVGLNPSTADESRDDPTIRRCVAYAKQWGYRSLVMLNLFAYRQTSPIEMKRFPNPIGPANDRFIAIANDVCGVIVAAWGNHGTFLGRDAWVTGNIDHAKLKCLGFNDNGTPCHPLYQPKKAPLISYPRSDYVPVS